MIVVVLVIGCSLGWIAHNAKVQRDAVAAIIKVRGQAFYEINPTDEVLAWKPLLAFRRLIGEYIGIDFAFHVMSATSTSHQKGMTRRGSKLLFAWEISPSSRH